jgi:hypothetical protein
MNDPQPDQRSLAEAGFPPNARSNSFRDELGAHSRAGGEDARDRAVARGDAGARPASLERKLT